MARPRKATVDSFFDVFASFPLAEQSVIVRVMERLVTERIKDEQGTRKAADNELPDVMFKREVE